MTGADSTSKARKLQTQLHELFTMGGFVLRKWKSSNPKGFLIHVHSHFLDQQLTQEIVCVETFTKVHVFGVEWDSVSNTFRPMIPSLSHDGELKKTDAHISHLSNLTSLEFSMFGMVFSGDNKGQHFTSKILARKTSSGRTSFR